MKTTVGIRMKTAVRLSLVWLLSWAIASLSVTSRYIAGDGSMYEAYKAVPEITEAVLYGIAVLLAGSFACDYISTAEE